MKQKLPPDIRSILFVCMGNICRSPPDARMRAAGRRRGLMKLTSETNRHKVVKFCSLCTRHPDHEVPDPYYGGVAGFDYVLDLMEDGCGELLARMASRS